MSLVTPPSFEVAVIGGGPAGCACAAELGRLGVTTILFEASDRLGGLLALNPFPMADFPATPTVSGQAVAADLPIRLKTAGVTTRLDTRVERIVSSPTGFCITAGDSHTVVIEAHRIVLATGVRARTGHFKLSDRVRIGPGETVANHDFSGLRVAVLGGGDNAFENARYALDHGAAKVDLYARHVRACRALRAMPEVIRVFTGRYQAHQDTMRIDGCRYDLWLVMYGWQASAGLARQLGVVTSQGFIAAAHDTLTSVPGVYAVGEVTQRLPPCCMTAMADGLIAARAIAKRTEPET